MTLGPGREQPPTRELPAADSLTRGFLFADLRGYTEYAERFGGEAAAQLLARYRDLVREQVARFRGAEIKTEGDSFYVTFPSVSAAVRAGLSILETAGGESAESSEHRIRVGIGVHAGETVETTEGYVGTPVNIAARLCSQAQAGELLVSDTVRALTSNLVRSSFVPLGRRRLKGIADPIAIFSVRTAVGADPTHVTTRLRDRRPIVVAAIASVVALVLVSALGLANLLGGPNARPSPPAVATTAALPSPTGPQASSGLTTFERDLLAIVPADVEPQCRTAPAESIARAAATLRCDLPLGSGADTVWWDGFVTKGDMNLTFDQIAAARGLPEHDCGPDVSVGKGAWKLGTTFSGGLLCYLDAGRVWVAWTYLDERMLARALRADGEWGTLYEWWRQTSALVKTG